jgi:hypothetical protein
MKGYLIILVLLSCIALMQCKAPQEIPYELPDAMVANVKIEYAKQCDKGKILYDINCASCHTTIVKRKKLIPDFTSEQLVGYELRVTNPQHEDNIPETTVSTEELGYIMTFLSYKKKSGIVVASSK